MYRYVPEMKEYVNSPPCHLCRGNPTIAECRASAARLRAYLVLFRDRYGDDLDERGTRFLERALAGAENLEELTGLPAGAETDSDEGETAGPV